MVSPFGVTGRAMKIGALVSIGTNSRRLVVFRAIDISTVVKGAILSPKRSTSSLILKMPMKTGERAVLLTLVLQKQRTLVHAKFLEILFQELLFIEGGSAAESVLVIIGTVWGHFYPSNERVVTEV